MTMNTPSTERKKNESPSVCGEDTKVGVCCFFLKHGECTRRESCKFRHCVDDQRPCSFGASCRLGHASRVLSAFPDEASKAQFWQRYNAHGHKVGSRPANRDATLLRSQLEPWPTSVLRSRLVEIFDVDENQLNVGRAEIMEMLLKCYEARGRPRDIVRVSGHPVRAELCAELLIELDAWSQKHTVNNRPSINAKSYMILRSPAEFALKDSKKANQASRKLKRYARLWELATVAVKEIDEDFATRFSALAVTYGFTGSPHIDKQNTGPFYGLSLGDFPEGQGGVCVECSAFVVALVNTKNRLGKVDGRFPHWVAPYDFSSRRYSLIFYQTTDKYIKPDAAVFPFTNFT